MIIHKQAVLNVDKMVILRNELQMDVSANLIYFMIWTTKYVVFAIIHVKLVNIQKINVRVVLIKYF